jgi:hypothetical protein
MPRRDPARLPPIGEDGEVSRRSGPAAHPVLSATRLNRATLARQLLLEPAGLDPVAAIEAVGGLQAQEPASPYLALWTRLAAFDAAGLHAAFHDRTVIKATLMRITLHAVSRRDYEQFLPALLPMLRNTARRDARGGADAARVARLAAATADFASQPRTGVELRDYISGLDADTRLDEGLWWWVRRHLPLVHVPGKPPWAFSRRPVLTTSGAWLGDPELGGTGLDDPDGPAHAAGMQHLVRRYLAAFGPATVRDVAAWSGAAVAQLRPAIAALDAAGILRRFADDGGRELLDLEGAALPAADVPAPPRLLPMWDNLLLAHADRTRVISDAHRALVIARNGDVLPSFLVDGRVAGLWWAEPDGAASRIVLEPFAPLPREAGTALESEAERLAAFVAPLDPAVFARYRGTRARRHAGDGSNPAAPPTRASL